MFGLGGPELVFILLIILLLFGGKRIPELMKSLGRGVSNFKQGMNELDVSAPSSTPSSSSAGQQQQALPPAGPAAQTAQTVQTAQPALAQPQAANSVANNGASAPNAGA